MFTMLKTLALQTEISPERELRIKVPEEVPLGPVELVVVISSQEPSFEPTGTAGDMLRSQLFGLWASRDDIDDSAAYARFLRAQAEQRTK